MAAGIVHSGGHHMLMRRPFAAAPVVLLIALGRRAASTSATTAGTRQERSMFRGIALGIVAWAPVALFITHHVLGIANVTGSSMTVRHS